MQAILIIQILVSALLTGTILLQSKGTGLGRSIGGGASYHTRRGMEKSLFYVTIGLSILFTLLAVIALFNQ